MLTVKARVFCVTDAAASNPWTRLLPLNAVHIDLGNTDLSENEKSELLARLLMHADVDYIHNVNRSDLTSS